MQPDLRTEHQKRISEAMKRWWARRRQKAAAASECPCDAERTVDPQCCAAGMCAREAEDAA